MRVLFLGGPWHDRREEVAEPLPRILNLPVPPPVVGWVEVVDPEPFVPGYVGYELRKVAQRYIDTPPNRIPSWWVYVAPDYDGPARH